MGGLAMKLVRFALRARYGLWQCCFPWHLMLAVGSLQSGMGGLAALLGLARPLHSLLFPAAPLRHQPRQPLLHAVQRLRSGKCGNEKVK